MKKLFSLILGSVFLCGVLLSSHLGHAFGKNRIRDHFVKTSPTVKNMKDRVESLEKRVSLLEKGGFKA